MTPVFDIQGVTKTYHGARRPANLDITMEIAQGEFFGLLGSNGAGKSTLVRQLMGLISPDSGRILLAGRDVGADPELPGRTVAYMPQSAFALNALTVAEAVFFAAHLRGLSWRGARRERDRVLDLLDLGALGGRVARDLSGGQRRLVQLAVTLADAPDIMILDEPTNELDPGRRREVWSFLREEHVGRGKTIILITHNALEADQVIERVGIMKDGRLISVGRPADLKRKLGARLRIELWSDDPGVEVTLPGYIEVESMAAGRICGYLEASFLGRLVDDIDLSRCPDLRIQAPTLEDLYLDSMKDRS
jgi:ABC-2 type transport system ATP-binding protein